MMARPLSKLANAQLALPFTNVRDANYVNAWRLRMADAQRELKCRYLLRPEPVKHLAALAALTDNLLQRLADDMALPTGYALVAVGGYGRGYLYPSSDVDMLILLPDSETAGAKAGESVERFVTMLWDVGLEPGIAVRTISECLIEAAKDVTVDTGLIEARPIWGDATLVAKLSAQLYRARNLKHFFEAKIEEQRKRHARHNDVALNLEPNIKESPGGLRDLQIMLWLAKAAQLGDDWKALAAQNIITAAEAKHIAHHERVLMDLRIRLHYLSGRREDRLVFDHQTALAEELKIEHGNDKNKHRLASEALMRRYYLTAKAIWQMNSILLTNLIERISHRKKDAVQKIDDDFDLINGNIAARDRMIFQRDPPAIFRAFLALQQVHEAEFFAPETLRAIWRAVPKIDRAFREDRAVNRLFLQILQSEKVTFTLRRMSRYGVLGRYIPAFGRIVGQMQHDLFHVYSVDEHILMVVRNLRRLVLPRFAHEFPFCHELARDFERPEILYLAALFHDIAKGRGGDHSELGKRDARLFCKKMRAIKDVGISKADADLVIWLVEMHLQMSAIAQKQDLTDIDVIAQFATQVGSERRLTALYLFTVADIRGTSPHVWNTWKARLLEQLFRATLKLLRGESVANARWIENKTSEALRLYREFTDHPNATPAFWQTMTASYFQRFEASELVQHAVMLHAYSTHGAISQALVHIDASHLQDSVIAEDGFMVIVMIRDQPGLFARITGYFERLQFDIASAKIFTTPDGIAFDTFQVMPKRGRTTSYKSLAKTIESELAGVLDSQAPISAAAPGRLSRQVKHFPIRPKITLLPSRHQPYFELSVSCADRPGLLSMIAKILLKYDINLHDARVSTLGQRAEDAFVIEHKNLGDAEFRDALQAKLAAKLAAPGV